MVCGILLTGCEVDTRPKVIADDINGSIYNVVVIDGCQYLHYGWSLAHKGNYTNKIHIYNK